MRTLTIITLSIVIGCVFSSFAFADSKTDCIYGSKINQTVSFYQARLYLLDSEYKVLSDIGKDAQRMITYLQAEKEHLVDEMSVNQVGFNSAKIKAYIVNRARFANTDTTYFAHLTP